jgi:hypothetical protein
VNRCAARGCGRWTRAGEEYCAGHREDHPTADGDAVDDVGPSRSALAAFRERLAAGDYDAVLGPGLRGALRGAAADASLEAEIGALRLVLARLLQEEGDPSRLASGVARVAGVSVQAARLRQSADADVDEVRATLLKVLADFEAEMEQKGGERANRARGGETHDVNGGDRRRPQQEDGRP